MNTDKVLMMYVNFATFVRRDMEILQKEFQVDSYHFNTLKKYFLPFAFLKQFFFLLSHGNKYKCIIIQRSGYVSFLPVLFGKTVKKKIIIIAIGTDCAKLPEISYGAHTKPILSWFTRFSFRNTSLILPVHKSLEAAHYTYMDVKYPKQGIKAFDTEIKTPIIEMVNGYDTEKWQLLNLKRKENSFLCVTYALSEVGYYRKGIDMIVALAELFPKYEFTIVGKIFLKDDCPNNIKLIENVPQTELLSIYNHHQYYLQLSMFEGFPNALCEAMLCGCIPIGSDVAGIPDIIGDVGYILKKKDIGLLNQLIDNLSPQLIKPMEVRNQIVTNFPLLRREREFLNHCR